ncbi:uncharacterized protein LOC118752058 [Rhagoletis pomonella]|uniref:uncharacterized protein LOC118752058 n=1 Tax=Rhagoletis pomonella TaxID=28610 RepID=UPI00177EBC3B|nr:uncharacterized protein LOC118752058 [Rhagoletis pomonella]
MVIDFQKLNSETITDRYPIPDVNMTIQNLDDVLIYSSSHDEHMEHIRIVINALRQANMKISYEKSSFFKDSTEYLGHIIKHNRITVDPQKTETIKYYPVPMNLKELRSFLGLAGYYRKFIKDYAKITKPLTLFLRGKNGLVKKNQSERMQIKLDEEAIKAMNILKKELQAQVELFQPDFNKPFDLTTDAKQLITEEILYQIKATLVQTFPTTNFVIANALVRDITDENEQNEIVEQIHRRAHTNYRNKIKELSESYYWPNMQDMAKKAAQICEICKKCKYDRRPNKLLYGKTPIPNEVGTHLHMDKFFMDNQIYITTVDRYSKFCYIRKIPDRKNTFIYLNEILSQIFPYATNLTTDNDPTYVNVVAKSVYDRLHIQHTAVPPLHSTTNGQVERTHSTIVELTNLLVKETKGKHEERGCDHWVSHYLATKLPTDTHTAWERHLGSKTDIPTFGELEAFLNTRILEIDAIENRSMTFTASSAVKSPKDTKHQTPFNYNNSKPIQRSMVNAKSFHAAPNVNTAQVESCALCGQAHIIRRCPTFLSKDCYERKAIVDKAKLCLNCLSKAHALSKCTSIKNCLQCGQRHHTLLHFPFATKTTPANNALPPSTPRVLSNFSNVSAPPQEQSVPISSNTPSLSTAVLEARRFTRAHSTLAANPTQLGVDRIPVQGPRHILLATASVGLCNEITNRSAIVHALIDQGSEGTLITENAVQQLGLQRHPTAADICGVGPNLFSQSRSLVSCTLRSCFAAHIESAYVLKQLTAPLPSQEIVPQDMAHLRGLALADPKYYQPKRIDLIIGADMIAQILEPETRIGHVNQPIAQKTHLGWILSGRINSDTPSTVTIRCHHSNLELEGLVRKFFENEHVPTSVPMSAQDQWCEDFFHSTYTRQANGKYLVRLPLKSLYDPNQTIGKSKQIALNRFHELERRLQRNADLREQYEDGIEDYFRLNQIRPARTMEELHCSTTKCNQLTVTSCVLPHHAVVKETSVTTKLRIVYDASSKTSNGRSLNDLLCIGPPLQNDLSAVILKWRLHRYVFLADIQKMYRCIDMNLEDSNYQRILWRNKDGHVYE